MRLIFEKKDECHAFIFFSKIEMNPQPRLFEMIYPQSILQKRTLTTLLGHLVSNLLASLMGYRAVQAQGMAQIQSLVVDAL